MRPKSFFYFLSERSSLSRERGIVFWMCLNFCFINSSIFNAQTTLYSEDFSSNNGKGQNATVYNVTGVTNWSIDVANGDFNDGNGDAFMVNNGVFYSKDSDGSSEANACWWYSNTIDISNYTNVSISVDLIPQSSSSSNLVRLYYSLNGGAYTPVGSQVAGNGASATRTLNGLSGSTLKIRVGYWGTNSTGSITHDNVLVRGTSTCLPTTAPSGIVFSNVNSQNLTVTWTAGSGDKTLVIVSPTVLTTNPASGVSYTANSLYGSGSTIGNGYVVFNGPSSSTSTLVSGLDRNTAYTFSVFTYNSAGNCYLEPGTSSSRTTANNPIGFYVDNNSNTNDVYTQGSAVGSNSSNGKKLTPFATLTYTLTQTIPGDTIYVDAGNYTDNGLNSPAGGVHIVGAGISNTVFVNPSADSYFMSIDDNNTSLSDLTLRDYNAQTCGTATGQVLGVSGATGVSITNVMIDQASTSSSACGYPVEIKSGANVTLSGGGQTCHSWAAGGGMHVSGVTTIVDLTNYLFYGNRNDGSNGTALRLDAGTVTIRNARFENNESRADARGAAIFQQGGTLRIYDSWFNQNKTWLAYDQIGGTILISGGTFVVKRSKFSDHTQLGGSTSYGAAIGVTGGNVTIDSCSFNNNAGSSSRARDVYNDGGTVLSRYNKFNSLSSQIGSASGTFTLSNSGSPTYTYSSGLTFTNSLVSGYTPVPSVPDFSGTCGSITLLPIEFLDMRAVCVEDVRQLIWSTGSEHNNAYFTIETGNEQGEFEVLTTVNGAGNSNHELTYQLPVRDAAYYRLSQTDYDGSKVEIKTVSASPCKEQGSEIVYLDNLHAFDLYLKEQFSGDVEFALINSVGQVIERGTQTNDNNSVQRIFLSSFCSDGMYFLQVTAGSVVLSEKFMIRKQ